MRLRSTPAKLEEMVRVANREHLVKKPHTEKWSAQEHAGHLLDLEPLWLARVEDYFNHASELTAADLNNRKTYEAKHNQQPVEIIISEFQNARSRLLSRVERPNSAILSYAIPHPRLKTPMRLIDHLYFVAEHDDHHLTTIRELLNFPCGSCR